MDSRDSAVYTSVQIGTQCWMKKNLNIGTDIPVATQQTNNSIIEKHCHNNLPANCETYGGLYMWNEMMQYTTSPGAQGICPAGWHLPADEEFSVLTTFLGGETDAGGKMKSTGTIEGATGLWYAPNSGATNSSEFTAFPGGYAYFGGPSQSYVLGYNGLFWSSTEKSGYPVVAWNRKLVHTGAEINRNSDYLKGASLSVRCIKNGLATVSTSGISNISSASASGGGEVIFDDGLAVTSRGICWNTLGTPTITDPHTIDGSGTGTFVSSLTGLAENTPYHVRAYATNSAGIAYGNEVSFTTLVWSCGLSIAVNHVAGSVAPVSKAVTYGTVNNIPGETSKCWITGNLGADHQATAVNDATEASAGWYWQFNRKQGYKHDGTTRTPNTTWISSINENLDWQTANDPCTLELNAGWRIPTSTEWTNVDASGGWTNWNGPWNSGLKLHAAGSLGYTAGSLDNRGSIGAYWGNNQNSSTNGWNLYFPSGACSVSYGNKAYGFSIRCIRDCTPQPTQSNAGPDQLNIIGTSAALAGNTPASGTGLWSIVSGTGGNIANPSSPTSNFTGLHGNSYTLRWTITTTCGSSQDDVVISFCTLPTSANAGTDQTNIDGTATTLAGNTPTVGTGQWSIVSGTGGNIANPSLPASSFSGLAGNSYTLRWTISNACGSSSDDVLISFWGCGQSITDSRDSKTYTTVLVGVQCWMKQNLNVGTFISDGNNQTNNGTIEKYCYDNSEEYCTIYGGLYQWNEMMIYTTTPGVKGICPTGWHLPTEAEWTSMTNYVSSQPANRCSSNSNFIAKGLASVNNWSTSTVTCAPGNNPSVNNITGFAGLPGGYRYIDGQTYNLTQITHWWSSTESSTSSVLDRHIHNYSATFDQEGSAKNEGFSVRCLKDCATQPTQADAGPDQLNIPDTQTLLEGNNPAPGTGIWSIISGTGGSFLIPENSTTPFWGVAGNTYTLRWTISSSCASNSDDVVISFWGCGQARSISHVAGNVAPVSKTVSYSTVTNIPGETSKCWITSNLGSDHQATAVNDITEASAGWYWQFNRKQGYKHDGTTRTPNTTWITPITESLNWQAANDPCNIELGIGWRIPTSTEWTNVDASGGWTDWNGPWNSGLKMHSAGYLGNNGGSLFSRGSDGDYWSSMQYAGVSGYYMTFGSSYSYVGTAVKAVGFSLRCIKD